MLAELYWIPIAAVGRLAIMPRPRGADWLRDEVASLRAQGVAALVSLLTDGEVLDLELGSEAANCREAEIAFRSFPILDMAIPSDTAAADELIGWIADRLNQGLGIAVHCRGGIGRSGLVAASVLVQYGMAAAEARATVSTARGHTVPETAQQSEWIDLFERRRLALPPSRSGGTEEQDA